MPAGFLAEDRRLLECYLPGLDGKLAAAGLDLLERRESPALAWFKSAGGPAMLVPRDLGGGGATLREGLRVQRAIGSRAPSLAVASTMHHFSVASLIDWDAQGAGMEFLLAEAVARETLLIASGVAEGLPGGGILQPRLTAVPSGEGYLVTGSKKPCSISRSMDLLFATVRVVSPDDVPGPERYAVAVIPADSAGLTCRQFWNSNVLAGAESDELVLDKVFVPRRLVSELGLIAETTDALRRSLVWFEILIAASYLGIAAALLERLLDMGKPAVDAGASAGIEIEGATLALEGVAARVDRGDDPAPLIGPALIVRYTAQKAIERAAAAVVEVLGGGAFIASPDVAYLYAATRCLAFHPPAARAAAPHLIDHLKGMPMGVE